MRSDGSAPTSAAAGDRDRLRPRRRWPGRHRGGARLRRGVRGDNSNIIGARVAREPFNVETVVARIYDPHRAEVYERLGIPTVATVRWTTDRCCAGARPLRR